jgi:hypothetical protein
MRVIPIDPEGVMAPTGRRECGVFAQLLACWDWHSCSGPNRPSQQSYRPRDRSVTCHRLGGRASTGHRLVDRAMLRGRVLLGTLLYVIS